MINKSLMHTSLTMKRYQGATIIGLMIGLLVSMIGILGSLSLYKTLTRASVDATFDTKLDGNAAMALSRVAYELQSAGFGLPTVTTGVQPHLKIISGQVIVWRVGQALNAADANVVCKRISEIAATKDGTGVASPDVDEVIAARKLILDTVAHTATNNCDVASDLADIDWGSAQQEVLNITELTRLDSTYSKAETQALILFDTQAVSGCAPYGMVPAPETITTLIKVSHYSSADLNNNAATRSLEHKVCIGNAAI